MLQLGIDHFMTVSDDAAVQAMRVLASGADGDPPMVAGESGAAGMAALLALAADPAMAREVGLDALARVLLINTEGATAPDVYAQLVARTAEQVAQAHRDWLAMGPR